MENNSKLRVLQKKLGLKNYELAEMLGCTVHTVSKWRSGKNRTPKVVILYLESFCQKDELEKQ